MMLSSEDVRLRRTYSSWSSLQDVFWRRREKTSSRRLQDECLLGTLMKKLSLSTWPALAKGMYVTSIYSLCSCNIESFFFSCVTLFIKIFNVKLIWGSQFVVVITTEKKWNSAVSSQKLRKHELCVYWTFCVCQFWITK